MVKVYPCKITDLVVPQGSEYIDPYEYTIMTAEEIIDVKNFSFEPACVYDLTYGLGVDPVASPPVVQMLDENVSDLLFHSRDLGQAMEYAVTITVKPAGYIYTDDASLALLTRSFTVEAVDPCESAELQPTISTIHLHSIIGNGDHFIEFKDYTDDMSATFDS